MRSNFQKTQKNQSCLINKVSGQKKPLFFSPIIQAKLAINQPNDVYEQEADAIADKVMRMSSNKNQNTFFKPANISSIQRKCDHCEEEEKLQMKSEGSTSAGMEAPPIVHDVINSGGQPLDAGTRNFFEPRFGYDFSNVKIHNNSFAAQSAQSINSLAYTTGNNIVFNQNQFAPETDTGKKLLAHELTHVVQQQSNDFPIQKIQKKSTAPAVVWGFEVWRNMCGCVPEIEAEIKEANDFGSVYSSCDTAANPTAGDVENCFDTARPGTTVTASTSPGGAVTSSSPATTPCERIEKHAERVHEHFHTRQANRYASTVGGAFYTDWLSLSSTPSTRLSVLEVRYPADHARFMALWNDGHEWAIGEAESYLWHRRFLADVKSNLNKICTP